MPAPSADRSAAAARRDRLRAALGAAHPGVDALLVTDLVNVRYLSGFTGSNGALLVWADAARGDRISTDGRYTVQVGEQAGDLPLVLARDVAGGLLAAATEAGGKRIGFEADAMSVGEFDRLAAVGGTELVRTSGMVEALREVKDHGEVDAIASACAVADRGLATILADGVIAPGRTERDVARTLEWAMYAAGAAAIAFETIVATGPNSAVPHHRPTDAVLRRGDLVKIDFGAVVDGYHSDMTRTFVLGAAQDWQREIYDVVADAAQAGRDAARAGARASDVDGAARRVIAAAGYGDNFVHGLGHGVGLQIHEAPSVGATAAGTLLDGAVVTVEPGVYLPGRGGVRIEDTVVVSDGPCRILTATDRTFTVLD
ncbi:MAG: aminopeptidase P family protein [Gordonia sp. (in: high G+C Gram-positive bacteria)]|uniref:aminopeptidase P family protein n=1 Tax=Gordonia sp. (in: high G+C Gram-positive bacteria) TaxID=84139 RepID=UPI0039E69C7F